MPLGSTAAAAEADARTHKKNLGSRTKILINVKIKKQKTSKKQLNLLKNQTY